jgi:hypothetical protein
VRSAIDYLVENNPGYSQLKERRDKRLQYLDLEELDSIKNQAAYIE